jgi:putative tRNA adenosine deaminase-associated protein
VSYFAAAAVRDKEGWTATELNLSDAADIEEVTDRMREVAPEAPVSLLFVESDDSYLVILRLDQGEDLRVFGSDSIFAGESRLGALLLSDIEEPALQFDDVTAVDEEPAAAIADDGDEPAVPRAAEPDIDPVGDPDLLADLGVPARRLLQLCAQEGLLPSDITAEVGQAIGCGDELEELREA